MSQSAIRAWFLVHKWSSIVCTAFLLMLCVTGLPLIFHHEIDELSGAHDQAPLRGLGMPAKSLDELLDIALADRPGHVGLYMSFDEDRPVTNITTGARPDVDETEMTLRSFDMGTGDMVGVIEGGGLMDFILRLHIDMFLGLPGMFFLGGMGALFVVALVSGVVLYAPFMRKLRFGTLRTTRSKRLKWLDYHNLLGIVALAWALVVGLTGVINTLATPIMQSWQTGELAEMTAAYRDMPAPTGAKLSSLQEAVDTARAAAPGNRIQFIAFPGGGFSSKHHYAIFMQGDTPLTQRLLTPALVDAQTGELTAIRPMPWYVQALLLSQPLHFGDYGGLPLKILWAVLDIFTIVILGSGLYLWLGRKRSSADAIAREVRSGGTAELAAAE